MDFYSKFILTIIAVSLAVIAVERIGPKEGYAGTFSSGPTLGDIMDLQQIVDPQKKSTELNRISRNIPLVRVQGGFINCNDQ
jgi:hypothetical protein